jgi:branched-chain amino acid transport system substrate-binding protein
LQTIWQYRRLLKPPAYNWLVNNYPDVKKVALCRIDDPGGILPEEQCVKEAESRGLTVVARETYMIGTEDLFPTVTKILQSKPDAIDMVLTLTPLAKGIIEGARQMGFNGPIFMGAPIGDINDLMAILKPEYAHDIFSGSPDVLSPDMTPLLKEFRPLVEEAQGRTMYMDNIFPLGTIYLLKQAIEEAQSFDTTEVAQAWLKMTSIDTIFGPGKMTGMELVGSNCVVLPDKLSYTYIMNGKLESLTLQSMPFAK